MHRVVDKITEDKPLFAIIARPVIESVGWQRADANMLRVYMVIALHAKDGVAWPSVETIASYAGVTSRTVQRTIARLCDVGLLEVKRGGGRKISSRYTLVNPDTQGDMVFPINHDNQDDTVTDTKRCQINPEKVTDLSNKVTDGPLNHDTLGVTRTEEQRTEEQSSRTAADCRDEILVKLEGLGIGEPTQSQLADQEGISLDGISRAVHVVGGRGRSVGLLVNEIRTQCSKALSVAEQAERRRLAEVEAERERADKRRQDAEERRQIEAASAQIKQRFDSLDHATRAELIEQAIGQAPPFAAKLWKRDTSSPRLQAAVVKLLGESAMVEVGAA